MVNAKIQQRLEGAKVLNLDSSKIEISREVATDISLNLAQNDIINLTRSGNNLIINLANGEAIIIENFYASNLDKKPNRLFISEDEEIVRVDTSNVSDVTYIEAGTNFEQLIFSNNFASLGSLFSSPLSAVAAAAAFGISNLNNGDNPD